MTTPRTIRYGLDDVPPPGRTGVFALQHVLTMFGSTVAVPLLLAGPLGLDTAGTALLISSVMLCSGVATLLQSTFGSRLPLIQGVSFSHLGPFLAIIAGVAATGDASPGAAMPWIAGAIIGGALVEMGIGFSGLMGQVRKVLSPVVVGPVITLIGLALYQAGAPVASQDWPIAVLTIALIVLFAFVLARKTHPAASLFAMFPMLLAILTAVAVCALLTLAGVYGSDHPARPDLSAFREADWVRTTTLVLPWGVPQFSLGFFVAILAGYLGSMIESFGDYHAVKQASGAGNPTPREISRGIGFEGVGCAITGLLGGFSSTSYSENVGLVGLTGVASRRVVQVAAVILVLLGVFGKFGALAAAIPGPVVGGLYCAMFGLIAAVGIRQFARCDLSSDRNLFIGGFALFMGLSVPYYFANGGSDAVTTALPAWAAGLVNALGSTGMAVGAILGLLLDNLVPGTDRERGLVEEAS
ncbi:uracil-xanthine permease family protein [Phycisphaera mikurensis]|uniref:Putative transporter n=1 Tax=Phycisphaera mikurensis (strain NBRC 102666 / KCTC 22515 / FYK2301M01) TaxID=1142394 RepID=I0IHD9_PHYMF|nr:solute carrier family 23 protein [Phycisphaera mikurensis]MBB6440925.1 uracil-xanthine permease [Phycisphaera mikurensis]BAM04677.1 putative transporter [Phycisphaera mikurensis NBRC 102666]